MGSVVISGATSGAVTLAVPAEAGTRTLTLPATTGTILTNDISAAGDTAAGDDAAVGYTAAEGLILTGQGSTSDVTIKNDADATVLSIPTGTTRIGIGTTAPDSLVEISSGAATTAKIATTVSNNYAELIFEDGNAGYGFQVRSDGAAGLATGSMVINDRDSSTFPVVINEGCATNTLKLSGGNVSMAGTLTASTGATIFNHLDGTVHNNGGSRAIGTNYTNSAAFDKIIYVSVSNTNANAIMIVTLDGDTIFLGAGATGDANYHIGATIIWPAGKVVNITMNGTPTLSRWVEYA